MQDIPQVSPALAGMSNWAMLLGADLAPSPGYPLFFGCNRKWDFFLHFISDRSLFVYKMQLISAYLFCVLLHC